MDPNLKATLRGLALCALVPAAVAAVVSPFLGVSVFIAAFALAAFVGYPLLDLLERRFVTRAWMGCLAGAAVGAATAAWLFLPRIDLEGMSTSSRGAGSDRVYTYIDGVPTQAAWSDFYVICAVFGIIGIPAGWVLWYHLSKYSKRKSKRSNDGAKVA